MSQLSAILYRSEAHRANDAQMLREIMSHSRARNELLAVTGILHHENGVFYQWLEGPTDSVRSVYDSVMRDLRHTGIVELMNNDISARNFRFWSMALSGRDTLSIFDWAAQNNVSLHKAKADDILRFLHASARRLKL